MSTVKDIIQVLEEFAPKSYAFEGDPIGLHVGSMTQEVNRVMVTLDVLESVVDEAIDHNIDLIIAHHPFIFKPLKSIDLSSEKGRIVQKLIQHNIAVYAAHTNLDITNGGVNDMLMDQLGIKNTEILVETGEVPHYKFVVFVPHTHENQLRNAISEAGGGHIGNYSHCTFNTSGTGTFKPLEGTNPFIGSQDRLEKVEEIRMETIIPHNLLSQVIDAANQAHPYEEMAYDVYPLNMSVKSFGLGRIGQLNDALKLKDFAEYVKQSFKVPFVRMVGDAEQLVRNIAVIGGDGNKYIQHAKQRGADVLITGDVYFHTAHDALGMGLSMIDPGHHVEQIMKEQLTKILKDRTKHLNVKYKSSEVVTEPFQIIC